MHACLLVHVEGTAADPLAAEVAGEHELGDAERLLTDAIRGGAVAVAAEVRVHLQDAADAGTDWLGGAKVRGSRVHERREGAEANLRVVAAPVG